MRMPDKKRDCCEVAEPLTPVKIENRPGLSAIAYRVGTYGSFLQTMLQAIATRTVEADGKRFRPLRDWMTRSQDDYGIVLLEMWAYLADILTFYQERAANEAFLRTALLPESVRRLAGLVDYKPAPGMAATAYLAFTVEKGKQVEIPKKLRVQSVPGQDEKPQKFETIEAITADAALNAVRIFPEPQSHEPLTIVGGNQGILAPSVAEALIEALAPGDNLVVFDSNHHLEEKTVESLKTADGLTRLTWSPAMQANMSDGRMFKWVRKFRLFGYNAPASFLKGTPVADGSTELTWTTEQTNIKIESNSPQTLDLDRLYDDLEIGAQILVATPNWVQFLSVDRVNQAPASRGPLNDTVTQLSFASSLKTDITDLRQVFIYELVEPEVTFWGYHYSDTITGDQIYVRAPEQPQSLQPKRTLLLTDGQAPPQVVTVTDVRTDSGNFGSHAVVTFTPALTGNLNSRTAKFYGNVVKATHGETTSAEILGNGDAASEFQSFALKKSPVTFVPDATASRGAGNTLEIRVGSVRWDAVETLFGRTANERVYTTTINDDSEMTVRFGDGKTGARLPSGRNNVVATYRHDLGSVGNVRAHTLTTLLDRPVGLKAATNPRAAQGGAEPENQEAIRINAPNTVRTFNRVVSLRDFEDAAREYSGIAKAQATWVWDGEQQVVFLTVAGDDAAEVDGTLAADLKAYLDARRDSNRGLRLESFRKVPITVQAMLEVDSAYVAEAVQQDAIAALKNHFAFENRALGQSVHLSDVYQALQEVEGVVAVDIDRLQFKHIPNGASRDAVQKHLAIFAARLVNPQTADMAPAELAVIEEPTTDISVGIGRIER